MTKKKPTQNELTQAKNFMVKTVLQAGKDLVKHSTQKKQIQYKGAKSLSNLVTKYDKETEKVLVAAIRKKFPTHDILGEEGTSHKKTTATAPHYRWIIDPIDGTTNFAHGHPFFAISVGLEKDGELILGVVYAPALKELYVGVKGSGATLNGKKIHVSTIKKLSDSLLATGFLAESTAQNIPHFQHFMKESHQVRRAGSAALDICYVATGRLDGFWELKLEPWDIAGAAVILREARGTITNLDGSPLKLTNKKFLITNTHIHQQMAHYFQKKKA